ncbi:MAG TPA: DUF1761 domain-containing protein [Patescibacteria group bacterium]|nr:DUF1761 domain-containing protein [Patescibacteria group bacterium]
MLEFSGLNYWALGVTWLINIIVGAFWYSPAGFGKQWAKLSGIDHMKIPEKEATKAISFVAAAALVQTLTLALIINSLNPSTAAHGLWIGLVLWLGLTAATTVGNTLYQRLSWKFWWLNSSYFLLVMAINSVILSTWR